MRNGFTHYGRALFGVYMKYIKGIDNFDIEGDTAITVGKFDGIHRGHSLLTKKLVGYAKKQGMKSVAITFDVSPRIRLSDPDAGSDKNIITANERAMLLEREGLDAILELEFTDELGNFYPID